MILTMKSSNRISDAKGAESATSAVGILEGRADAASAPALTLLGDDEDAFGVCDVNGYCS